MVEFLLPHQELSTFMSLWHCLIKSFILLHKISDNSKINAEEYKLRFKRIIKLLSILNFSNLFFSSFVGHCKNINIFLIVPCNPQLIPHAPKRNNRPLAFIFQYFLNFQYSLNFINLPHIDRIFALIH